MLSIKTFTLGPVGTNAYLVGDNDTNRAVVIDPAWDGERIVEAAESQNWQIGMIWLTHAHFDHIAGASGIVQKSQSKIPVALHPDDRALYDLHGGAALFGFRINPGPQPEITLANGAQLSIGRYQFEVRHAPGHTPGHVVFYCPSEKVIFCGDVIFQGSIGRTDLPGGDYETLLQSIRDQILNTPDETRLLSGHGPETTVGIERFCNPFLT